MNNEIIDKILQETEVGYDLMADKFSETRKFFWRGMEFIGNYAKDRDRVLDYGCGNGRLLELLTGESIDYIGVDVSQKLIDLAKNKYSGEGINFFKIDVGQYILPFEDNFFNSIYSIAVFHHFPAEYAEKIARELFRITKPDGYIIVSVWNLWPASRRQAVSASRGGQKKYFKNILKNWLDKVTGNSNLDWNDCYVTFKNNQGETFHRFHHAFTKRELGKIFEKAGFQKQKQEKINGRNLVFLGKK